MRFCLLQIAPERLGESGPCDKRHIAQVHPHHSGREFPSRRAWRPGDRYSLEFCPSYPDAPEPEQRGDPVDLPHPSLAVMGAAAIVPAKVVIDMNMNAFMQQRV